MAFTSDSTKEARNAATDAWFAHQVTDSGTYIEGYWEHNKVVGNFLLIKPNGNSFIGTSKGDEIEGFIYPHTQIAKVLEFCRQNNITEANKDSSNLQTKLNNHILQNMSTASYFKKLYGDNQLLFISPVNGSVTRRRAKRSRCADAPAERKGAGED